MEPHNPLPSWPQQLDPATVFLLAALAIVVAMLLLNIQGKKDEAAQYPLKLVEMTGGDRPGRVGQNFLLSTNRSRRWLPAIPDAYGRSNPYSKLNATLP